MGYFTQVRGWLNIDSIGCEERAGETKSIFEEAKRDYLISGNTSRAMFVIQDTILQTDMGNGSAFIFIGTELKNYENDAEEWIKYLISKFDSAEGAIYFRKEEESTEKVWIIFKGELYREDLICLPFEGYGNCRKG